VFGIKGGIFFADVDGASIVGNNQEFYSFKG
jgi:hypothetical protein